MKGNYKFGIVVLLLFTISTASAITQIGDNITVPNNVTAQNFLGNLSWTNLLGIPTDFPNATVAGYNGNFPNSTVASYSGNFPNTSVTNIQGVNTAQNTSISNLQSNDTVHDSKISTIQSNETGYAKLDGTRTVTGSWNWGGFNLTNALRVVASFFEGDGSRLSNLNASNLTGTFNASTDTRTNFPNSTVASKEASWDGKTTLAEVNRSADLYNVNASNITSGQIPSVLRLPAGTVILLSANETDSSETTTSTTETTLMTYNLPANSYSKIIVEAEVQGRINSDAILRSTFTWRFYEGVTTQKTFIWKLTSDAGGTAGDPNSQRQSATLKASFAGGQGSTTTLSITGQMGTSNANIGMLAHSFRVYGVI